MTSIYTDILAINVTPDTGPIVLIGFMSKDFNIVTGSISFYASMLPAQFKITIIVVTGFIALQYYILSISVWDRFPIVAFVRAKDINTQVAVMVESIILEFVPITDNGYPGKITIIKAAI